MSKPTSSSPSPLAEGSIASEATPLLEHELWPVAPLSDYERELLLK